MKEPTPNSANTQATFRNTLLAALWFGLVCGLLSGGAALLCQQFGWLNWDVARYGLNWQILWVEPFFNSIIFLLTGLLITLGQRWLSRLRAWHTAIFVFTFLTVLNWLFVSGRIKQSACVILALGIATVMHRWLRPRAERLYTLQARTILPLLVGTLLLAGSLFGIAYLREQQQIAALPPAPPGRPNVVLIVMDTVRADHLSSYGYSRRTSPFLDRLAKEGVLFENAMATSSWTLPSHASLMSGQYVHQHGTESGRFVPGPTTLPLEFQKHGYRTAAISANQAWFTRLHGFGKGFSHFEDFFFSWRDRFARTVWGRKFQKLVWSHLQEYSLVRRFGEDVTNAALDWCGRDAERPFFLFLNYFDAHPPYLPPRPWRGKFIASAEGPGRIGDAAEVGVHKLSAEELAAEIGGYDGGIAYVDEQIRRLAEGLRERGQLQNTIVVITSDHGEQFGERGYWAHRNSLYMPTLRVPLLLYAPSRVPQNLRIAQAVSIASIPRTLLELAGIPQTDLPAIQSLVALWNDSEASKHWPVPIAQLAQMRFPGYEKFPSFYAPTYSLVTAQWQYVYNEKSGGELFEWPKDPRLERNLAATADQRPVVADFSQLLRLYFETVQDAADRHLPAGKPPKSSGP